MSICQRRAELWVAVAGHPKYEVNSRGVIRRCAPAGKGSYQSWPGRVVGVDHGPNKYVAAVIGPYFFAHQVVASTFYGPCPPGHVVNHKDGVKNNNAYRNLEYVTRKENNEHAERTGLSDRQAALALAMQVNRASNFKAQKENTWQAYEASKAKNWEGQRRALKARWDGAAADPRTSFF